MFDGGADFAQGGVESGLAGGEIGTGESFERDDLDALDTDVSKSARVDMSVSMAVRLEASKAWTSCRAPWIGIGPTVARRPPRVAAIWMFIPGYPALAEYRSGMCCQSQREHRVVHQHRSRADDLAWMGHELGEHLPDRRTHHRITVGWLTPKIALANSWVMFLRSGHDPLLLLWEAVTAGALTALAHARDTSLRG